jgi:hypothetical protein
LVIKDLERDTAVSGDVVTGKYVEADKTPIIRTMGIDCPIKRSSVRCTALRRHRRVHLRRLEASSPA